MVVAKRNPMFLDFRQNHASEFLNSFLVILSDELNTSPGKREQVEIDHYDWKDEDIYRATVKKDEFRCKSIIEDTFTGRYKTTYKCLRCKSEYKLFEKFNLHYVSLPPPKKRGWNPFSRIQE